MTEFAFRGVESWNQLGEDDWFGYGVEVDPDADAARLGVDTSPTYRSSVPVLGADAAETEDVRVVDLAVDDCGHLFVLVESGAVYRYDPRRESSQQLTCLWVGDGSARPTAICLGRETLYVGFVVPSEDDGTDSEVTPPTGRIHAISRSLFQTRWVMTDPLVHPFRIVETDDEVYVLDVGTDRLGTPGDPIGPVVRWLSDDGTTTPVLEEVVDPRDMTVDDDGRLIVLDRPMGTPRIRVFESEPVREPPSESGDNSEGDDSDTSDKRPWRLIEVESERLPAPKGVDDGEGHEGNDDGEDGDKTDPGPFDLLGTTRSLDPSCIAVAAPGQIVAGVDATVPGDHLLYRYRPLTTAFERIPAFAHSCVRLVLEPNRTGDSTLEDSTGSTDQVASASTTESRRRLFAVDDDRRTLYVLEQIVPNRRGVGGRTPYTGRVIRRLDAGEVGTRWHRVTANIVADDPGTQVRLHYYATDDPSNMLEGFESIPDVGPESSRQLSEATVLGVRGLSRLSASDVSMVVTASRSRIAPWLTTATRRADRWTTYRLPNPVDVLLDDVVGRYLWVELELIGSEFTSPLVEGFRAYFPRQSYLRYLPAIYRDDEASARFLEQYLSLFESVFVDVDEELATFTRFLDPSGIPPEYLSWLGGWFATATDEVLSAPVKRALLMQAPALFKMRGTRAGLRETVNVVLDHVDRPTVDWTAVRQREQSHLDRLVADGLIDKDERAALLASHAELEGEYQFDPVVSLWTFADLDCLDTDGAFESYRRLVGCPQCFLLLVGPGLDDAELRAIERLVENGRPAQTVGRVAPLRRELRLGGNAFLGINAALTEGSFVVETATLGADSVLDEREPYGQLGFKSRLGRDAELT